MIIIMRRYEFILKKIPSRQNIGKQNITIGIFGYFCRQRLRIFLQRKMLSILITTKDYDCRQLVHELHRQGETLAQPFEILVGEDGTSAANLQKNITVEELQFCRRRNRIFWPAISTLQGIMKLCAVDFTTQTCSKTRSVLCDTGTKRGQTNDAMQ